MEEKAKADKQNAQQKNKSSQDISSSDHSTPHDDAVIRYPDVNCLLGKSIRYAICLLDNQGKIISVNPYFEYLLGFKKNDLHGKHITDFLLLPSVKEFSSNLRNSRQNTESTFEAELKTREGSGIWVSFNITPFTDEKTGSTFLLSGLTEITAHKHLLDDLSLCTDVLDAAPDAIFLRDAEGNYLYANETACKERGYTRDEILKLNIYQLVAPEAHAEVRDKIRSAFAKGRVTFNSVHITKDGSKFPVEVHLKIVEHGGKKLLLSIVHNRSQRKKIEEELMRALKMESVVLLASGIASRFNTLLTHILGNLNVLLSETELHTTQSRLIEETTKIVDKAHEMIRHLSSLSISRAPFKKTSQVGALLKDTTEYVLTESNTWSNFFIADNLQPVELDQAQFIQAFTNIVLNASQSMPKGGVINVAARNIKLEDDEVSDLPEGDYIKISVTDTGHGIDPEDMLHIFDPYFSTRQGKVGLGLSIAYSVTRNHGGAITVDSEHGKGSSFHIFLPASTEEAIKEPVPVKQRHPGVKILLVDDEAVVRTAGSRILSKLGYNMIEFASGGQEALNKYQQATEDGKPYDIVIVDLTLPGEMGGKEVIKALRKLDPGANILVSGGYFNDPILTDFHRYGIKGILAKPYQIKELEIMLHESDRDHELAR